MNYKQIILFLLFYYCLIGSVNAQNIITPGNGALLEKVPSTEYQFFYSKDAIDQRLVQLLRKEQKFDLTLVNPGEEFNFTDVVIEGVPNKRLIMVGEGSAHVNFILYENGGNARYNVCLVYTKEAKNKYKIEVVRLENDINSFEKLKDAILHKDFVLLQ